MGGGSLFGKIDRCTQNPNPQRAAVSQGFGRKRRGNDVGRPAQVADNGLGILLWMLRQILAERAELVSVGGAHGEDPARRLTVLAVEANNRPGADAQGGDLVLRQLIAQLL